MQLAALLRNDLDKWPAMPLYIKLDAATLKDNTLGIKLDIQLSPAQRYLNGHPQRPLVSVGARVGSYLRISTATKDISLDV